MVDHNHSLLHNRVMDYTTLATAVSGISGSTFIGLDTLTNTTLKGGKSNPMQGLISKRMTGASVMAFQNKTINGYESMIQRRLVDEGKDPTSFVLGPRTWGARIPNMPIVEHKGNYYLEVIFLNAGKIEYLIDGAHIDKKDIIGLQESIAGEQGGLDNTVYIRVFNNESITEMRIDGKVFR